MGSLLKSPQLHSIRILLDFARRDFKLRYTGSILGTKWNYIHPLVMILVYTLVFSKVMGARLGDQTKPFEYSIYLCSALLPWNFFVDLLTRQTSCLTDNAAFLKKMSISPIVLF